MPNIELNTLLVAPWPGFVGIVPSLAASRPIVDKYAFSFPVSPREICLRASHRNES